ncbi:hypothetical protein MHPYR_610031 [uncultured Mycobacterium sp.]|uniref:Transposase IS110-like N-terminal domain-containing protein n=1 Tax=uncultured Mycobacterium sp. TaxID=171292 RepID=A0A1Y5PRJ2_9MYCO|nr:transposase [Mycolicibacterium aromaticivorans]SBS78811.1 hypothetical protein MHPYR_610031 [uncultured Mycobacterium sp.]
MTTLFCGIDWGEARHDVAIIDETGKVLARDKITADAAGFTQLLTTVQT